MPETLNLLGRERTHEQSNRDAVPGSEGPGGAAPCGARLPPLARGGAEDCESHGEHHSISPRVKPGQAIRRPRDSGSGRAEKTPKRLNGLNRPGRRGPGQVAPGRGHGGLYHARLASFPIHMGALLTHRDRCSETGLGKFLEFFLVKIGGCWCEGVDAGWRFFTAKTRRAPRWGIGWQGGLATGVFADYLHRPVCKQMSNGGRRFGQGDDQPLVPALDQDGNAVCPQWMVVEEGVEIDQRLQFKPVGHGSAPQGEYFFGTEIFPALLRIQDTRLCGGGAPWPEPVFVW